MNTRDFPADLTGQERVDAIRSRLTLFDTAFLERRHDWLKRLEQQDIGDDDVPLILAAADTELSRLDAEFAAGRIDDPGRAVARAQLKILAEAMLHQDGVSHEQRKRLREHLADTFPLRFLEGGGRFTFDWFYYHESQWRKHFSHLAGVRGVRALEIGCFEGRATSWLLREALTGEGSHIVCVDHFEFYDRQEQHFDHNVQATGQEHRVVKLRGLSQNVLHYLAPQAYDFIYVDGGHGVLEVVHDTAFAWRLLKPGGIVVFDDYADAAPPGDPGSSVQPTVDAFLAIAPGRHEVIFKDWQLAVRKLD